MTNVTVLEELAKSCRYGLASLAAMPDSTFNGFPKGSWYSPIVTDTSVRRIALPDMPQYRAQTKQVSTWVVDRLGLHWLFVAKDGMVEIVHPNRIEHVPAA
jgi:hypothetical protein